MVDSLKIRFDSKNAAGFIGRFGKQVPFAMAVAMTRTVVEGKKEMTSDFRLRLKEPTRYTLNSVFAKTANKRELMAAFGVKDNALIQKSGGLTPVDVLGHHFYGGKSVPARYEKAFRRIGMLGVNEDIVPAKGLKELNRYGNVPSGLIVRLLSYFQAFGEQGYRANSTSQSRARLAKVSSRSGRGRAKSRYVTIRGVVYFYANGRGHLHRGIWAKTGVHGIEIRPILMFVKRASYRRRFNLNDYKLSAERRLPREFSKALNQARRNSR